MSGTAGKTCTKCLEHYPAAEGHFNRGNGRDGYTFHCKRCLSEYAARYRRMNRVRRSEYARAYQADNPEANRKATAAYRRRNPEVSRVTRANARARLAGAPGKLSIDDVRQQRKAQGNHCHWCGKGLGERYHIDHAVPLSRGGHNTAANIVVACPPCNRSKFTKTPEEFRRWMSRRAA